MLSKMLMTLLVCLGVVSCQSATNDTWNYDQHGQDWDFQNCNDRPVAPNPPNQSPAPLYTFTNTTMTMPLGWIAGFGFLTGFYPVSINASQVGVVNYVYTVNLTEVNAGGFYAGEPLGIGSNHFPYWNATQLRFHFPAEHPLNDTVYDAEFQIITNDTFGQGSYCANGKAALSLLIKIDDTKNDDWFSSWVGKTQFDLNLNDLLDQYTGMTHNFIGYHGTDTMPDCLEMCWYIITEPFYIHQSTFDALKAATPGVDANNRVLEDAIKIPPSLYYSNQGKLAPLIKEPVTTNSDL